MFEKFDQISILPNETVTLDASFQDFGFPEVESQFCLYIIGANLQSDDNFNDNIYCTTIDKLTTINEIRQERSLKAFPNPTRDEIQLVSNNRSPGQYNIYSLQGKLISVWQKRAGQDIFDISSLVQGTYIVIDKSSNSKVLFTKI